MFKNKNIYLTLFFLIILVVSLSIFSGTGSDYGLYLKMWSASNAGANPWSSNFDGIKIPNNSYGPLHSLLGYLALINSMMPKILIAITGVMIFIILLHAKNLHKNEIKNNDLFFILISYPLFPLTIISTYLFGINDSIVALIIILACESRKQERMIFTGVLIGLAALLKFYPILFLAFFSLDTKKGVSFKCILSGFLIFIMGMLIAYLIWGNEVFSPFIFGAERSPKLLSIFKFVEVIINSYYLSETSQKFLQTLLSYNTYILIAVVVAVFIHSLMAQIEWEYVSLIGILLIFASYKVGHPHFYLSWAAMLAWVFASSPKGSNKKKFAWHLTPILIYLGFFQSLYLLSRLVDGPGMYMRNDWEIFRDVGSVPFIIIIIVCLFLNRNFFIKPWKKNNLFFW